MARFTRRQLITSISVVYLAGLTVLAGYALRRASYFSLPISNALSALTVALPPLAGIALEMIINLQQELAAQGKLRTSRIFQAVNVGFVIYETVLATLAGTHVGPSDGRWCTLHDKWEKMWKNHDGKSLERIQDAFNCCGLNTNQTMAYPFPDKTHGTDRCVVRYDRTAWCLEPWKATERQVAIMLLIVPLGVFLWKVALFFVPGLEAHWLPSAIRLPRESNAGRRDSRPRPAIAYRDIEDQGEADSTRVEVNRLNEDSDLAARVQGGRVQPSPLIQEPESNTWSRD